MATVARTPDAELLLRLRRRDRKPGRSCTPNTSRGCARSRYRLAGNAHDADDLVQETFVRAVPRLDRLDPATADVGAYLFTTLQEPLPEAGRAHEAPGADGGSARAGAADADRGRPRARACSCGGSRTRCGSRTRRLQPRQRLVLALRELEDRSYAEIGELVGMKENAVAQLIFRARESLRTRASARAGRPGPPSRGVPPLPAAARCSSRRPAQGRKRDETLAHLEGCERCQDALAEHARGLASATARSICRASSTPKRLGPRSNSGWTQSTTGTAAAARGSRAARGEPRRLLRRSWRSAAAAQHSASRSRGTATLRKPLPSRRRKPFSLRPRSP